MEGKTCATCGTINVASALNCVNCGLTLPGKATTIGSSSENVWGPPSDIAKFGEEVWRREVDRTKNGFILLAIGVGLAWLPGVDLVGLILICVGAILVILGRKSFGIKHARMVVGAIIVFFISLGLEIGAIVAFTIGILNSTSFISGAGQNLTSSQVISSLQTATTELLVLTVAASILGSISYILLSVALQETRGKIILAASFVATVGIGVFMLLFLLPTFIQVVSTAVQANNTSSVSSLSSKLSEYTLLNGIPDVLMTIAFYLAYKRVESVIARARFNKAA